MITEEVAKLTPTERFLYWIRERHSIHLKREAGKPKPWTDDGVMQTVFFTNPYRENDKTTVWFRNHVREPLHNERSVLMATVIFRWFNLIRTGETLIGGTPENPGENLIMGWNEAKAVARLRKQNKTGPAFTGAYMIKAGNGPPGCKIPNVCESITRVWKERDRLIQLCHDDCRLEALWQELKKFQNLGGFMSYEIVCDLRYTDLLENATDVDTWCNPGPGALRGLTRLTGEPLQRNKYNKLIAPKAKDHLKTMQGLLALVRKKLSKMPHFELREIEHSLCEWDKYERARLNDGKLKRIYKGAK